MEGFVGEVCGGQSTGPFDLENQGLGGGFAGVDDNGVGWTLGGVYDFDTDICTWTLAYGAYNGPPYYVWRRQGPGWSGSYTPVLDAGVSVGYQNGEGPCDPFFEATTMTVS